MTNAHAFAISHLVEVKLNEEGYSDASARAFQEAEAAAAAEEKYPVSYPEPFNTIGCGYGPLGEFTHKLAFDLSTELRLDLDTCHQTTLLLTLHAGSAEQYAKFERELLKRLEVVKTWVTFKPSLISA